MKMNSYLEMKPPPIGKDSRIDACSFNDVTTCCQIVLESTFALFGYRLYTSTTRYVFGFLGLERNIFGSTNRFFPDLFIQCFISGFPFGIGRRCSFKSNDYQTHIIFASLEQTKRFSLQ